MLYEVITDVIVPDEDNNDDAGQGIKNLENVVAHYLTTPSAMPACRSKSVNLSRYRVFAVRG